jgi:hypothetical protein
VATRSKACICGRSIAGISGSNPTEGMDVCLSLVSAVCCQVEVLASDWSLVERSTTEWGVSECDREACTMRRLWPTKGFRAMGGEVYWFLYHHSNEMWLNIFIKNVFIVRSLYPLAFNITSSRLQFFPACSDASLINKKYQLLCRNRFANFTAVKAYWVIRLYWNRAKRRYCWYKN